MHWKQALPFTLLVSLIGSLGFPGVAQADETLTLSYTITQNTLVFEAHGTPNTFFTLEEQYSDTWVEVNSEVFDEEGEAFLEGTNPSLPSVFRVRDENDNVSSAIEVEKARPTLTIATPETILAKKPITVKAWAVWENNKLTNKNLQLTVESHPYAVKTGNSGVASKTLVFPRAGVYTLKLAYPLGDPLYSETVTSMKIKVARQQVVFTSKTKKQVKDGSSIKLAGVLKSENGERLTREHVSILVEQEGLAPKRLKVKTNSKGYFSKVVQIYRDASVTAQWHQNEWHAGGKQTFTVSLIAGAPKVVLSGPPPAIKLPPQPRAITTGANVRIVPIPETIWRNMQGKSWHAGCMARSSLRYLRVNYWGFDGFRHQGELVVNASIAYKFKNALQKMYAQKLPLRSMYLVDRFGYSPKLHGANDYRSMRADNTSAFNCRGVVGNPSVKSPHATGRAWDLNTWENPYNSKEGWTPNTYWAHRSHPRVAWKSGNHPMVKLLRSAGFHWTYGVGDSQHFDG